MSANHLVAEVVSDQLATGRSLDHDAPILTILVPTLNEELTIGAFLDWCHQGIERCGVRAEIIIVDSSTDSTAEKARALGARVVSAPRQGLGRAYQTGIPAIRGRYVIMGDADCTYDFRELVPFLAKLDEGYEFVMGSRFKGFIEPDAMPALHRYFGTPVTTWILNVLYGTRFSDIHCGMRAITRDALLRMELQSVSWQYASEMVLKSVHMRLRTAEVPVRFFKDPEGRLSHHKRSGWLSPWKAGWTNLEVMLTHGAEFFTFRPGIVLTVVGLSLTLPLTLGPVHIGRYTFSLYWMLMGMTLSVLGAQTTYVGCLMKILQDYRGDTSRRLGEIFEYNRSVVLSLVLLTAGIGCTAPLVKEYVDLGFTLSGNVGRAYHMAITGLLLVILAFTHFVFTLVLQAMRLRLSKGQHRGELLDGSR